MQLFHNYTSRRSIPSHNYVMKLTYYWGACMHMAKTLGYEQCRLCSELLDIIFSGMEISARTWGSVVLEAPTPSP